MIMLIQRNPDIYLDEIREHLQEEMGKTVALSTIYRNLAKIGFTRKTVCVSDISVHFILTYIILDHKGCKRAR
jgi:hypothetical protein